MSENTRVSHLQNLIPLNLAVAGYDGDRFLIGAGTMGSLYDGWHKCMSGREPASAPVKVRCTTLKEIFARYDLKRVRFLKSDCEGTKFEIFANTPPENLCRIDRISMDYHLANGESCLTELLGTLESAGFEVQVAGRGRLGMAYARSSREGLPE